MYLPSMNRGYHLGLRSGSYLEPKGPEYMSTVWLYGPPMAASLHGRNDGAVEGEFVILNTKSSGNYYTLHRVHDCRAVSGEETNV